MFACRWLRVFALVSCVVRTANAGLEELSQAGVVKDDPKLMRISTELSPAGNLSKRCFVSRIPTRTPLGHPACSPPETPTTVYDPESLFNGLTDVSLIREEAKNYFVSCSSEKSLGKAEVLGIILNAMLASSDDEELLARITALKARMKSSGGSEMPVIVVVCLPEDAVEKKVVENCTDETVFAVASSDITSSGPYVEVLKHAEENERQGITTLIDVLKGRTGDRDLRTPTAATTRSPPSKTTRSAPVSQPRDTSLQLSVSGIIKAVWPISISRMTAQLSLSFAPAGTAPPFPASSSPLAPTKSSASGLSSKTPRMTIHNPQSLTTPSAAVASSAPPPLPEDVPATSTTPSPHLSVPFSGIFSPSPPATEPTAPPTSTSPTATELSLQSGTSDHE